MTGQFKEKVDRYASQLAWKLRQHEANSLRGQPERLNQLEITSDLHLLKKFLWRCAIISTAASFFGLPLLAMVIQTFVPLIAPFLWAVIKIAMAISVAICGLAAYYTFSKES